MTATITQTVTTFLEDLKSADLVGISFSPQNLGLGFYLTFGPEAGDVKIEISQIIHLFFFQALEVKNK